MGVSNILAILFKQNTDAKLQVQSKGAKMSTVLAEPCQLISANQFILGLKSPVFTVIHHHTNLPFLPCSPGGFQYVDFVKTTSWDAK